MTRSSTRCRRTCSVTSSPSTSNQNAGVTGQSHICTVGRSGGWGETGGSATSVPAARCGGRQRRRLFAREVRLLAVDCFVTGSRWGRRDGGSSRGEGGIGRGVADPALRTRYPLGRRCPDPADPERGRRLAGRLPPASGTRNLATSSGGWPTGMDTPGGGQTGASRAGFEGAFEPLIVLSLAGASPDTRCS